MPTIEGKDAGIWIEQEGSTIGNDGRYGKEKAKE